MAPDSVDLSPVLSKKGNVLDAGEIVCCKNGHYVCIAASDLKYGQMNWWQVFADFAQPEPMMGGHVPPCIICKQPWLDRNYGVYVNNIDKGIIEYRGA